MRRNRDRDDIRMMKCVVLAGITVGIAITEVKRVIVGVKNCAKKIKAKFESGIRDKHVD